MNKFTWRILAVAVASMMLVSRGAESAAALFARGDMPAYKVALDAWLDSIERTLTDPDAAARWQKLSATPGYLHTLAQAELLRVTGLENVAKIMATPNGRAFLSTFMADPAWLEMYLVSGPVPEKTPDGLATLRDIWLADRAPDAAKYRHLATAVALVFNSDPQKKRLREVTTRDRNPLTPPARYQFFKASHKAGKLKPLFDKLATWELRWVVVAPVENEALAWLQEHVNVPLAESDGVCWIPRYRGVNDFGNTVQGPLFYPARSQINWAEDTAAHGGVCGALSTFGTFNAMAHGVPATTKGQPGHCAHAIRLAPGDWKPCFGGPDGSAHLHFGPDIFAYVWQADDAFGDFAAMRRSTQLAWRARRTQARGDFAAAIAAQPLNHPLWQEYISRCQADPACGKDDWKKIADDLLRGMAKHPRPMCDLLALFDEKNLWTALNVEEKTAFFLKVHELIATNQRPGWSPWEMPRDVLAKQLKALGDADKDGEFFGQALAAYVRHGQEFFIGKLIDWGTEKLAKSRSGREQFFAAITAALGEAGGGTDDKIRRKVLESAIRATEEARSVAGFQMLSAAAKKFAAPEGKLKLDTPRGKLVSADGLLYLSGFDGYDPPLNHRGVLTEDGGLFHCQPAKDDKDGHAWVVVQLRGECLLSGLALGNRASNQQRCKSLRISTSTDEKTWKPLAEIGDFKQQYKLDVSDKAVRARWVKIENTTPKSDAFHLRNVCIFGKEVKE
ncbi:MAG: discoidin domain-containing protein [Kiritimatiellaeota bacterium]|nr:discoidin domain-containing protein [Kiritimatiellota bacterium]